MTSREPAPTRIRFDAFELDATSGELRESGTLRKLQPQPFRVLLLLIEHAGQVVTREEIQRCLWRDSTFVDFEHGINFSINQIRGALADNAEDPRYVETLPRRGYRFIGTVEQNLVPGTLCVFGELTEREIVFWVFDPVQGKRRELTRISVSPSEAYDLAVAPDGSHIAVTKNFDPEGRIRILSSTGEPERDVVVKGWG